MNCIALGVQVAQGAHMYCAVDNYFISVKTSIGLSSYELLIASILANDIDASETVFSNISYHFGWKH